MKIIILPRHEISLIKPLKNYAVITIADHNKAFAEIPSKSMRCAGVLECHFDDIVKAREGFVAFTEDMAKKIWAFVDSLKGVEELYINCEMGRARSAAVAAAISIYKYGADSWVWDAKNPMTRQYIYSPNLLVYKTMLDQKGLKPTIDINSLKAGLFQSDLE